MGVRERIRAIRLLEKLLANPQWAKNLGIEGCMVKTTPHTCRASQDM